MNGRLPTYFLFVYFLFSLYHYISIALQPGDRITAAVQSHHGIMKTPWLDLPLEHMPIFGTASNAIIHVPLPELRNSKGELSNHQDILNLKEDLIVTLSFDRNKLLIPQLTVYDSENKRSVRKLIVTLTRDEFEIVRLSTEVICKFNETKK